jgi:hypothetical protein
MGFPLFLSEIAAIVGQKSSLEANWLGVKMKPAVPYYSSITRARKRGSAVLAVL